MRNNRDRFITRFWERDLLVEISAVLRLAIGFQVDMIFGQVYIVNHYSHWWML